METRIMETRESVKRERHPTKNAGIMETKTKTDLADNGFTISSAWVLRGELDVHSSMNTAKILSKAFSFLEKRSFVKEIRITSETWRSLETTEDFKEAEKTIISFAKYYVGQWWTADIVLVNDLNFGEFSLVGFLYESQSHNC